METDYLSPYFPPGVKPRQHLTRPQMLMVRDTCMRALKERLVTRAGIIQVSWLTTRAADIFSLMHRRKFVQASNKYWSLKLIDLCIETIFTQAPTKESENTVNCDDDD